MLIKTLFKRRDNWWVITDKIDEANFVWTQIKVSSVFSSQNNFKHAQSVLKTENGVEKKNPVYKRNKRILNGNDLGSWMGYFHKNREVEEKMVGSFARRNKILKKNCVNFDL